jgi:hypothetical protein
MGWGRKKERFVSGYFTEGLSVCLSVCPSVHVVLVDQITRMSEANWLVVDVVRLTIVLLPVEGRIETNSAVTVTRSQS